MVLPYDAERRCALVVRLFRAPVFDTTGEEVLEEACAGMIGNEDAETAGAAKLRGIRRGSSFSGVHWSVLVRVPASRLSGTRCFSRPIAPPIVWVWGAAWPTSMRVLQWWSARSRSLRRMWMMGDRGSGSWLR